eukprot:scaffold6832_cov81-Skeletonema_menzelii.AAC.8
MITPYHILVGCGWWSELVMGFTYAGIGSQNGGRKWHHRAAVIQLNVPNLSPPPIYHTSDIIEAAHNSRKGLSTY